MLRRTRRVLPLLLAGTLALGLSSCGDDGADGGDPGSGGSSSDAFDAVSVSGDPGEAPEVEWSGDLETDEIASTTLVEGDGDEIASGDSVLAHVWIGNGFTEEQAFSSYDNGAPELLTVDEETLSEVFLEGVEGHAVGSRVAVAAPAEEAFGPQGNPQLGIGNKDTILVVVDLVSGLLEGPEGAEGQTPGWAPEIVEEDGAPARLDFAGTPKPTDELRVATLVEGDGAEVEKKQTIAVSYLGQVYGGKQPFDQNFSGGTPTGFQIGVGRVVQGWDQGLVGQTVGSRVLLAIPPDLGYGKEGNTGAGIEGDDTLYFVVDILAAG